MKGLLVIIIFLAVVTGAAYGFAATLVVISVDDIGNQTETTEMFADLEQTDPIDTNEPGVSAVACAITGGINCIIN